MTIYTDTTVRLTASFAGFDGLNLDPTTVTVRVKPPAAIVVSSAYPAINWVHPETGVYAFDLPVDDAGVWQFSFEGGGSVVAYNEASFTVIDRSF